MYPHCDINILPLETNHVRKDPLCEQSETEQMGARALIYETAFKCDNPW